MHSLPWITILGSLVMRFTNDFNSWLRHSWKYLANGITRDPKLIITATHALFYMSMRALFTISSTLNAWIKMDNIISFDIHLVDLTPPSYQSNLVGADAITESSKGAQHPFVYTLSNLVDYLEIMTHEKQNPVDETRWPYIVVCLDQSHKSQCTCSMCTFLLWMVLCWIWNRCTMGFVN